MNLLLTHGEILVCPV